MNTWVRIISDAGNLMYWLNSNNITKVHRNSPNKCTVFFTDKTSMALDISIEDFRKAAMTAE